MEKCQAKVDFLLAFMLQKFQAGKNIILYIFCEICSFKGTILYSNRLGTSQSGWLNLLVSTFDFPLLTFDQIDLCVTVGFRNLIQPHLTSKVSWTTRTQTCLRNMPSLRPWRRCASCSAKPQNRAVLSGKYRSMWKPYRTLRSINQIIPLTSISTDERGQPRHPDHVESSCRDATAGLCKIRSVMIH